jgi:hypothetical protein
LRGLPQEDAFILSLRIGKAFSSLTAKGRGLLILINPAPGVLAETCELNDDKHIVIFANRASTENHISPAVTVPHPPILTYFERRMAFNGIFICEDGKVVRHEHGPYFGDRGG